MKFVFEVIIEDFTNEADDFFDHILSMQKGLFMGYAFASAFIFFCYTQILIWALNNDIWKGKRLLALYPLQQIASNIEAFKQTMNRLS